jgi:predicted  nucleic acid-binding Zn-ribbon protein
VKSREQQLQDDKVALEKEMSRLDNEGLERKNEFDQKTADRLQFFSSLPRDAGERYQGILRGRSGFHVLASIKGMICGGCQTHLPPSVVNETMKGKDMVICESCSRILYYIPPPEPVAFSTPL